MRRYLYLLLVLLVCSCEGFTKTDFVSVQSELNGKYYSKSVGFVLDRLGQPTSVDHELIDSSVLVTVLHYTDSIVFDEFVRYCPEYTEGEPYVDVYAKEGVVYSTKSNMVRKVTKKDDTKVSVFWIASACTALAVIALVLLFVFITVRRKNLAQIESVLIAYTKDVKACRRDVDSLWSKMKDVNAIRIKVDNYDERVGKLEREDRIMENWLSMVREALADRDMDLGYDRVYDIPLDQLKFSAKAMRSFMDDELYFLGDLCVLSENELNDLPFMTFRVASGVISTLAGMGLSLNTDIPLFRKKRDTRHGASFSVTSVGDMDFEEVSRIHDSDEDSVMNNDGAEVGEGQAMEEVNLEEVGEGEAAAGVLKDDGE